MCFPRCTASPLAEWLRTALRFFWPLSLLLCLAQVFSNPVATHGGHGTVLPLNVQALFHVWSNRQFKPSGRSLQCSCAPVVDMTRPAWTFLFFRRHATQAGCRPIRPLSGPNRHGLSLVAETASGNLAQTHGPQYILGALLVSLGGQMLLVF